MYLILLKDLLRMRNVLKILEDLLRMCDVLNFFLRSTVHA